MSPTLSKAEYKRLVTRLVRQWETQLNAKNALVLARQIREYERISRLFESLIQELLDKVDGLSPNQIFQLAEFKRFQEEITRQLNNYAAFNAQLTNIAKNDLGRTGLQNSYTLLNLINTNFSRLPVEAINNIIARTAEGTPLLQMFQRRFGERAENATSILIDGIARGQNPITVGRHMMNELDTSRYVATRITRTEALNTYNDVSYSSYVESGIVKQYGFIAEPDACEVCLDAEANAPYDIDDIDNVPTLHPHCRCSVYPL